ncbi:MAG: hypothetical protein JXB03_10900 [Spirochaetales bacterium]|nr:hypothetical protein [Spirochaetales bacterium]
MGITWVFSFKKLFLVLAIMCAVGLIFVMPAVLIAGKQQSANPASGVNELLKGTPDQIRTAVSIILEDEQLMDEVADDYYWAILNGNEQQKLILIESFVDIVQLYERADYADGEILLHMTLLALGPESAVQAAAKKALEALQ